MLYSVCRINNYNFSVWHCYSLNPYSFDGSSPQGADGPLLTKDHLPFGAVALFSTGRPEYYDAVIKVIAKANSVYNDFLRSEEGNGFCGQV